MAGTDGLSGEDRARFLDGLILTGQFFWEPTGELCEQLYSGRIGGELSELARLLEGAEVAASVEVLAQWPKGFASAEELCTGLASEHTRLFVSSRGGVPAPPYQSVYEGEEGLLMGPAARDMEHRLAEVGVARTGPGGEPADHLAVELEYLVLLLEAAWEQDRPDLETEARNFAAEVMLPWVDSFSARLAGEENSPFHQAAAGLVKGLLGVLAAG